MKKRKRAALIALLILPLIGCSGNKQDEYGNKPDDWKKSSPPPTYKGPGQPDAPAATPAPPPAASGDATTK